MVALSRSDSKDLAEFSKTLVGTGPGTQGSPAASRRAHQSNRLSKQGWPGERSLPFQGRPSRLVNDPSAGSPTERFSELHFLHTTQQCNSLPTGLPGGPTIS